MSRITGSQYQCRHCSGHFAGSRAFELHFASDGDCLTPDAMSAAGLQLSSAGFWAATLRLSNRAGVPIGPADQGEAA
jgi:hypothetical protein